MKKTILLTSVVLLLFGLTTASYAAHYGKSLGAGYKAIEGKGLSVNQVKSTFVIQDKDDGTRTTVYVSSKQIASLNSGDFVKVTLSIPGNRVQKIVR